MKLFSIVEGKKDGALDWAKAVEVSERTAERAAVVFASELEPGEHLLHVWGEKIQLHRTGCPMITTSFEVKVTNNKTKGN